MIAVELTDRTLLLYWLERGSASRETVSEMASALNAAEDELLNLDDRIQRLAEADDS